MALVIFKSRASADIMMIDKHAKPILDLLGKDIKKGVITAAETASAIEKLEKQINKSKEMEKLSTLQQVRLEQSNPVKAQKAAEDKKDGEGITVSFATRAYPFLQMLKAANKAEKDVMWGV